MEVKMSLKKQT